jgi:O-antigen/teichoic acid export membrane protein
MIARKSTLIITTNLIEAILAYVALFFIARFMGPGDYGIIGFATGFVGLFALLSNLGFNQAHIKRVSEGKDLGTCIATFIVTKIGLVSLMATTTILAIFFWKYVLGRGFESTTHETAIFIILVYFVLERLSTIFQITFTAETKIAKAHIPKFIATITRTGAIIFVALMGFGAIELAFAYVFGHLFLFVTGLLLFRKSPVKKPSKDFFKDYSKFAFPLIVVSASAAIMTNIDKVLIQLFWSAEEVGYYFASYRICGFIVVAGASIGQILFPMISDFHSKNDIKQIKKILLSSERYISMITFPMVVGLAVLAEPAVDILLSGSFYPAISVFRILPFFALLSALIIPYNSQFLGMNNPKLSRNRILIMVCFNIVLNITLIPKNIQSLNINLFGLGAYGAAISTVISYCMGLLYCKIAAWRLLKIKINLSIIIHVIAASIMGLVLYLIDYNTIIPILRWYELLLVGLFGLGIYLGILILLKEFTKNDFTFFIDTLNIKKMWKYIKKEIRRE